MNTYYDMEIYTYIFIYISYNMAFFVGVSVLWIKTRALYILVKTSTMYLHSKPYLANFLFNI